MRSSSSHEEFIDGLKVRSIEPRDLNQIKELHEEFFPVRYKDVFYELAVQGEGIRGMPLYTLIVTTGEAAEEIVGFALAQFLETDTCEEHSLFYMSTHPAPPRLFYILTLGVRRDYRQRGIASALVLRCSEHAATSTDCGLV
jgi:ribosomal protein S18 acetylase RimI-like enzyme